MNTEIKTLDRFEEAGFNVGQSKAMVVGIDDLLVKSTANFNQRMDALEKLLISNRRDQAIGLISVVVAILIGFTGLIYAVLK